MSNHAAPSDRRGFRLLSALSMLVLLSVVSCNFAIPGITRPTATPTVQPTATRPATAQPQPTKAVQANLPPALVESAPIPNSEIGLKQPFIFYFNQAMEKGSVEAALQAQPALAGSFKWLNDFTVSFTPDQPLPKDTSVDVTISTKARAANGLALAEPVDLAFHTAAGFQAVERLPLPDTTEVSPDAAVVVTFDRPIVPLGADSASSPAAFTLDPAANGRAEWLNTSTYILYPIPGLKGGVKYTVHLNQDLVSTDGTGWKSTGLQDWSFTTQMPQLLSVTPTPGSPAALDTDILFIFNQAMNTASVQQNFSLKDSGGAPVTGKTTWDQNDSQMTFQPDQLLSRGTAYTISLSGNAQSSGGTPLGKDVNQRMSTVGAMAITGSSVGEGGTLQLTDGNGMLQLQVSSVLPSTQDREKFFSIEPAIDNLSVSYSLPSEYKIYIFGNFAGRTNYRLRVSRDLADKWGQSMAEDYVLNFTTSALKPALRLNLVDSFNGLAFLTPNDSTLSAQVTNINSLHIEYGAMSLQEFAAATENGFSGEVIPGTGIQGFDKPLDLPADRSVTTDIPVTPDGKGLAPGLYYYAVQSPQLSQADSQTGLVALRAGPALPVSQAGLVVSRVHLTMKVSPTQVFVWAVNLDTNQPVPGARLSIYQENKGVLAGLGDSQTDENGIAKLNVSPGRDPYGPIWAVMGQPGDANFSLGVSSWNGGLSPYQFGLPVTSVDAQPLAYLYTDRPIYRPGQTIDFRLVLRQENNGRYSLADFSKVTVEVYGDYSATTGEQPLLAKVPVDLSDYGAGSGSYQLLDSAAPGYYHLQVAEIQGSYLPFQVAEYRKPEIDLAVNFDKKELLNGQDISATIKARYYFGAPAGNMGFDWNLVALRKYFDIPGSYQTGVFDPKAFLPYFYSDFGFGEYVANGQGTTNPDGSFSLTVPGGALKDINPGNIQDLMLSVTLHGQGEFPVSADAHLTVHPAKYYIGIKPEAWSGQAKQEAFFSVFTVDWQGKPSGNQDLTAAFKKATWKDNPAWTPGSDQLPFTIEYSDIGSTDLRTDAQGQARFAFTPDSAGTYLVDVRDKNAQGQVAQSQVFFWVGGVGSASWPALPNQQIRLSADADSYQPGQTAKIFIPNPLGDSTLALVTVERSKVMRSSVVAISGTNYELDLPLSNDDAPNVYVSAVLLGKDSAGQPDFRLGYVELNVDPAAEILNVQLTPQPAQVAPAGEVKFTVQVKDSTGAPVQGEFSLAVVDKAVLALADPNAPAITKAFYDPQPLGVVSSLSLAASGRRLTPATPGGRGGGGGMAAPPSVRENFQDTAYWSGTIVTDANGAAEVTVKLPDNLTTWVATLRGVTKDSRVGEAVSQVVVSKDLLIRPVTPRFLVAGDHIQLAALVHNNTANPLSVDVSLQSSGADLDDPGQAIQKVDVPANDRRNVTWWVKVQDTDKVDLLFTAASGSLQDASRPANGTIPVEVYSSPQSFGTSGILAEAGQHLEVVSVPRSFTPTGGSLRLEMSPSLAAAILDGLKAMETFPSDFTEPVVSKLLPNLETYKILQDLGLDLPNLKGQLQNDIKQGIELVSEAQNSDGGWGWAQGQESSPYLSAYALYVLARAGQASVFVDAGVLSKAQDYLTGVLVASSRGMPASILDQLAFEAYALQVSGKPIDDAHGLFGVWEQLSPWAKAMLAMTIDLQNPGDTRTKTILSSLTTGAVRSSTGAYWDPGTDNQVNYASANFTSAVVITALAHFDPASPLLADGVRYLVAHRSISGCWASSFESAWILQALAETLKGTGDLQANFAFSASLNDSPLLTGQASGASALTPVEATLPLSALSLDAPNALKLVHESGNGRLYYRAFLQVDRPVESAQPLQRGISISRGYYPAQEDCRKQDCQPVDSISLGGANPPVRVRLSITVPRPMYAVVVEDFIPAGAEVLNLDLNTSQVVIPGQQGQGPLYDPSDPFASGWGSWYFGQPTIYDDHIRWIASSLPAGTYQLTYLLTPLQAGEFRLIPAHAYQFYFPDTEGTSAGAIFKITP